MQVDEETILEPDVPDSHLTERFSEVREEKSIVSEDSVITMTRRQMYDEIWQLSVNGVANKYDLPYAHLLKMIKQADIPIPPSGYWVKLNFNKPVTKPELPEPAEEMISIYRIVPIARKKRGQTDSEAEINATVTEVSSAVKVPVLTEDEHSHSDPPPVTDDLGKQRNHLMNRNHTRYMKNPIIFTVGRPCTMKYGRRR